MNRACGKRKRSVLLGLALVVATAGGAVAQVTTRTWSGGGADANWGTAANWNTLPVSGNALTFTGTTKQTNSNNSLTNVNAVTFSTGGFSVSGNPLTITPSSSSTGITNTIASGTTTTWGLNTTLGASQTFTSTNAGSTLIVNGTLNDNTRRLTVSGAGDVTINGVISGTSTSRGLTKSGSGTLLVTAPNSYRGPTLVSAGVLRTTHNTGLGTAAATVSSGATLSLYNSGNLANALSLSGTGTTAPASEGAVDYEGGTNGLGGPVTLASSATIGGDAGATLNVTNTVSLGSNRLTLAGDGSTTISGVISGTGGLTVTSTTGIGELILSGNNTYTGSTLINSGTLEVWGTSSNLSNLGNNSAVTVASGATLELNPAAGTLSLANSLNLSGAGTTAVESEGALDFEAGSSTITGNTTLSADATIGGELGATLTMNGNVTLGSRRLTVGGDGNVSIAGVISGSSGSLAMSGTGVLALTNGGSNTYSGGTFVNNGTLQVIGSSTLGSGAVTVSSGATLSLQPTSTLTLSDTLSLAGIGFPGRDGAVDFETGSSTVSGAVTLTADASIGGDVGATLTVSNTVNNGGHTLTTTLDGNSTFGGVISGAGGLTVNTTGSTTLAATNTYSGTTTIATGTLKLGASGVIPDGSGKGSVVLDGGSAAGTLDLNGYDETINGLSGASGAVLGQVVNNTGAATKTLTVGANNTTSSFAGVIKDNGGSGGKVALTKTGSGTLTLSGASTYTGATTVSAGKMVLDGRLASGSAVTVSSGATLGGHGTAAGSLAVNGTLSPGDGVGTLGGGATTWNSGASYTWEIDDATGTAGADPGWDLLNVSGNLDVQATSGAPFTISLVSLNGGSAGQAAHFDNSVTSTWIIATASGSVLNFAANKFSINTSQFQNALGGGTFSVAQSASSITLVFTSAYPTVTTTAISSITETTATSGGTVVSGGGSSVTARGVCWNTTGAPTVANSHTTDGTGTGSFTSSLTGLTANLIYHVRAYATNSAGTIYGNELTFSTLPIVLTTAPTSITATSASSGGNVTLGGSSTVSARGVCWSTSANPTIADSHTSDGSGTGSFTSSITGLTANTLYHVRAYATNTDGTGYGADVTFTTQAAVTTTTPASITATSASSGGSISNGGGATVTARGVCWSGSSNPTTADSCTTDGTGTGSFTSSIAGLGSNTLSHVRAYATNAGGTAYGNDVSFTTLATLTTTSVTNIAATTATSGGTIAAGGGQSVTARGVCWSTAASPTTADSHTTDGTGTGVFSSSITGLTTNLYYHVRAYATNAGGTAYGNDVMFSTLPTVTTTVASAITATSASSGGEVTAEGGASVTVRGVCWSTSTNPTTANACTAGGSGGGSFTSALSGLTANTLYHIRAYATNSYGTGYGGDVSFTTLATLSTTAVSAILASSASSGGTVNVGGNQAITARGVCWSTSASPTTADSHTTDGTGAGTFTSSITGLTTNLYYHVRAYATNAGGTAYGNDLTFSTLPTVTTTAASAITNNTATGGGNVSAEGGASVTARGVCWSADPNPTIDHDDFSTDGTGGGTFASALTILTSNELYHVRAYATNSYGTVYGNEITFTTLPTVATAQVNSISPPTAQAGGTVEPGGGETISAYGVCWSTSANPTTAATCSSTNSDIQPDGTFTSTITGLSGSTAYHVRAYATNVTGTSYGADITFSNSLPTVSTDTVVLTTETTADAGGAVTSLGGSAVSAYGVCWNTSGSPTTANSHTTDSTIDSDGTFTSTITGLTSGIRYFVRAYATNGSGTAYGDEETVSTKPTVTTATTSATAATTASSGGTVVSEGYAGVTVRGVCWSTSANPTTAGSHTTDGSGPGTFTSAITGLTSNTLYHVRAYATNSYGTDYGADLTFTTLAAVTTTAVSGVTATTASSGGTVAIGGAEAVGARGVCWSTVAHPTVVDTCTTDGSGTGTFTSALTGLTSSTNYYYRAYATNAGGVGYGNELSLWTSNLTRVELEAFHAIAAGDHVDVRWQTGLEVDNLGFNLYRDSGGQRTLVNNGLIAGSALLAGPGITLGAGQAYGWIDAAPAVGSRYWLEDADLTGHSKWYGPVAVEPSTSIAPLRRSSARLAELAPTAALTGGPVERRATLAARPTRQQTARQAALAAGPAVKLMVRHEGWYRVTQEDLVAAGLDPDADPAMLQLFVDGKEQAIVVQRDTHDAFGAGAAVEFYGMGLDSAASDARAYWLVVGARPGRRIGVASAPAVAGTAPGFRDSVERADHSVYFSSLLNGDTENFFGAVIHTKPVEETVALPEAMLGSRQPLSIQVTVQGVTQGPHRVGLSLNGVAIGELDFDSTSRGTGMYAVPMSLLDNAAAATLRFDPLGGTTDASLVDTIRIRYPRSYAVDDDALKCTVRATARATLTGFSDPDIRVMDVTRADSPRVVPVHVEQRPDGFAARLSAPGGNRTSTLLAFTSRRIRKPDAIVAHAASIWARPDHAADLVVIGHHDLLGSVEPLRALRVSQGMAVAVIDVENLYDEFGFGSKSPQAIRDFLRNAVAAWNTAPRFVLLLGDASLDPKNYLGNGDYDFVPTRLLDIHTMETASDGWFADFSGTGVPALAIGRLPVRTSAEADRLIAKLLDYEHGTTTGGVLLVSGTARGYDFAAASERISGFLTESVAVDQIQFDAMPLAAAKAALFQHLGSGERIVNYQGHGSVDRWGSSLLAGSDAPSLTNAPLSVFFMFTCLNGYFHDPALDSLAESLLKAGPGGAVAVYASSGMSDSADEDALNSELFQRLFTSAPQAPRGVLGEAALAALAAVKNTDVRRTYHLFGDPTMRLP